MEQLRYLTGGLNLDDSVEVMSPDDYSYMKNLILGRSTAGGKVGLIETIKGTTAITMGSFTDSNSTCIGVITSRKDGYAYLFFHNTTAAKNCILRLSGSTITNVITWSGLNFDLSYPINGGAIAGDLLYFTDNYNEPRCLNVTRYVSTPPTTEEEILLIKRGPQLPPTASILESGSSFSYDNVRQFAFQFAYYYVYFDNQVSVLSPYSKNTSTFYQEFDSRSILVRIGSSHPVLVKEIVFAARVGETGSFFDIGKVTRTTPGGAFSGGYLGVSTQVKFTNTTNGNIIASTYERQFEPVPINNKSMTLIKNRLWLANNKEGYDPGTASINFFVDRMTDGNALASWPGITGGYPAGPYTDAIAVYTDIYQITRETWVAGVLSLSSDLGKFICISDNLYQPVVYAVPYVIDYFGTTGWVNVTPTNTFTGTPGAPVSGTKYILTKVQTSVQVFIDINKTTTQSILVPGLRVRKTLSNNSQYKLGIIWKDGNGRSSGVVTSDDYIMSVPSSRGLGFRIRWEITSYSGIPSWAKYYSIVSTKNLKKDWFIEYQTLDIFYTYVDANGNEVATYSYSDSNKYLKINIAAITQVGLGYDFVAGDRIVLYNPDGGTNKYDLEIIDFEDGQYVVCANVDITNPSPLTANTVVPFEIYRPKKNQGAVLFREHGEHVFSMTDGGYYTMQGGVFEGDVKNVLRPELAYSSGLISLGSINKVFYKSTSVIFYSDVNNGVLWGTNAGKPYIETKTGQIIKKNSVRASNPFIANTAINGLSEFVEPEETVPIDAGQVMKLQPTTRVQADGDVLLAICENDTASIYVGETQLTQGGNQAQSILSTKLIGDIRMLKSGFGTQHPESVLEYNGDVFWFDLINRAYVRYSTNGIFPISEYKVVDHFEDQAILNASTDYCVSGYDPYYKCVFVTFKNAVATERKTINYSQAKDRWISFYDFAPRQYFNIKENLFSVVAGVVYRHNSTTYNTFYGSQFDGEVIASFNDDPASPKYWELVKFEVSPNLLSFSGGAQVVANTSLFAECTNDRGQLTSVTSARMEPNEYVVYGALPLDFNSPGGFLEGDDILSNTIQTKIRITTQLAAHLKFIAMGFTPSVGHTV